MASAAQIAWRKEFARRAKAGTLKKNPLSRVKLNSPSMATGEPPSKRLKKRRKDTQSAPPGYYANPIHMNSSGDGVRAKNPLSRVKLNSPSMATGEAPSKRLKKRRKNTQDAPPGYYANPMSNTYPAKVDSFNASKGIWESTAAFVTWQQAVDYGHALQKAHPKQSFRVRKG